MRTSTAAASAFTSTVTGVPFAPSTTICTASPEEVTELLSPFDEPTKLPSASVSTTSGLFVDTASLLRSIVVSAEPGVSICTATFEVIPEMRVADGKVNFAGLSSGMETM